MPIEIKELHIRITVNTSSKEHQDKERQLSSASNHETTETEALIAECVEQVLQILQNKLER